MKKRIKDREQRVMEYEMALSRKVKHVKEEREGIHTSST